MQQFHSAVFQHDSSLAALLRRRALGWTAELRGLFLDHLRSSGNVRSAAKACGLSRQSVYNQRRRDEVFAREWDAALIERSDPQEREFAAFVEQLCRRAEAMKRAVRERNSTPWTPST